MYISPISSILFPNRYQSIYSARKPETQNLSPQKTIEKNGDYIISIPLPGLPTEDIKVTRNDKIISVSFSNPEYKGKEFIFEHFALKGYDVSKMTVKHKFGMLSLTIPKTNIQAINNIEVPIEI